MTINHGCLVFGRWEEGVCGGVCGRVWGGGGGGRGASCEMEGWGLGEVKGQRKKGGKFSEDGRLEETEGNNNSHVLKAFLAPLPPPPPPHDTSEGAAV